jgi:subfamily B ATP-binding cassette protein MsbA
MLRLIGELLRPYRWHLVVILTAVLFQAAIILATPWPFKLLVDSAIGGHAVPRWAAWFLPLVGGGTSKMQIATLVAIMTVAIAVFTAASSYINLYVGASLGQWVANDLRLRTYHHLQRLSLSYYETHQVGAILSTVTDDVNTIQLFASQSTVSMVIDFLTIIGMVLVMFFLRLDFALIAIAVFPFLIFFVARVRSAIQKATADVRIRQAEILATAEEGLEAVQVVEAFEREELVEQQMAQVSRAAVFAAMKARRARALLSPVVLIPISVCTAFVLWRGAYLVPTSMTLGSLIVFFNYLSRLWSPVQDFSSQADNIAQTAVAVQRIRAILEAGNIIEDSPDAIDPPPLRGDIAFEHVAFSYDADNPVLREISFTVDAGQLVGIVGPTGSGKSTAMSFIPRFYDPDSGSIKIDGRDIRNYKVHGLRGQIGFVLQETVLFRGTVRENIAFGRPGATEDEIVEAAQRANADGFISRMPHGYDTIVGQRGASLSGGQRQRIGIARALIRNDPILILDEPTASLDAEAEEAVIEALGRLMKGRTVLCIAHRLSTIHGADKIIVIKDCVVAEQGTHQELLAENGVYAELHRLQYR